ncbi:hypothetical protein M0R45_038007 [Rubus argutus]|uniref:Uncharacterized protein n=1 Tax=Rubus argutus TaxID=59490 RepID=A0AAW1W3S6_RUBAR
MYSNANRAYFSCDVCSLLGSVSFIMFFGLKIKDMGCYSKWRLGSNVYSVTHEEEHGLLTLCGMHDSEAKPVLLCSCNDNAVLLYDSPSAGGLFFTGDGTGQLRVWKRLAEPVATS